MAATDIENGRELGLQDEDRLPWLEAVESDEEEEGLSASKLLGFLFAALIALGIVIGGIWWLRSMEGPKGDGTLIAAQEGPYKTKPDQPGGMKVEGQGDSAFAASEGAEATGKVDMNSKPEAPVAGTKAVPAPVAPAPVAPGAKSVTTSLSGDAAKMPAAPAPLGTALIQLGAYGSQVGADQTWGEISGKVPGLAGKSVLPAAVNGKTVYRLRANAGTPANAEALCAKVKAAGTPCMVVR